MRSLGISALLGRTPYLYFYGHFFDWMLYRCTGLRFRGAFENRIKEIAWHDFQSWIDSGNEIGFNMDAEEARTSLEGLTQN